MRKIAINRANKKSVMALRYILFLTDGQLLRRNFCVAGPVLLVGVQDVVMPLKLSPKKSPDLIFPNATPTNHSLRSHNTCISGWWRGGA